MPWNNQDGNQGTPPSGSGNGGGPWGSSQPGKPDDGKANPSSSGGSGGNRRPSGGGNNSGGGRGNGPTPPDLNDLLQRGHAQFRRMMPGGLGQQNIFVLAGAAIFTLWLLSGFYRVQPDEQGIPKVFGKASLNPVPPGLHYNWPSPVGSVVLSRTGSENRIEVGFTSGSDPRHSPSHNDSLMLTGDENVIDIKFVVLWKINDPLKYEFNIRDQEHTITRAAESAIRAVIGETPIQAALTEGREEISTKTQMLLQKMLDEYDAGVTITGIELQAVAPPEPVIDAFSDVQRAHSEAERMSNDAETYRNKILPQAQGEAARKRQDAIGYKAEVVNRATGDADRFKAVLQSYAESKDVTQRRLYLETMEEVLKNSRKIVTDSPAGTPVVLPYQPPAALSAPAAATAAPASEGKN